MEQQFNQDKFFYEQAEKWNLKTFHLPISLQKGIVTPIFELLNNSLLHRHKRKQLLLPNFCEAESVMIFSDYSGEAPDSRYSVYSFLFADYNAAGIFAKGMTDIRNKYFSDNISKEIAFKDSHYGPINRSIDEYLYFANNFLNGLVFTLIVDKSITSLIAADNTAGLKILAELCSKNDLGNWKPKVLEKGARILYIIAYFCKLLVPDDKKIFWMTDADSIMPNRDKAEKMAKMLQNCLNSLEKPPEYDTIGFSMEPFVFEEDKYKFRDILSIADLVAGSVEHYFTRKDAHETLTINAVAKKTLTWLSEQGVGLKKLNFIIKKDNNQFSGSFIDFNADVPIKNARYIDYIYNSSIE